MEDVIRDLFEILVIVNVSVNVSCDVGEYLDYKNCKCYLDYKNCKCRKRLIGKLAEKCRENIDGNKVIYNSTFNDYRKICNSWAVCIVLLVIFFIISINISSIFIYFHWYLKRRDAETAIY